MLTIEQLDHLCMLTALDLSQEEKELLLPQLSHILDFVGQLDQCVIDEDISGVHEEKMSAQPVPTYTNFGPELLDNIRHEIVDAMPHLKSGLVK